MRGRYRSRRIESQKRTKKKSQTGYEQAEKGEEELEKKNGN